MFTDIVGFTSLGQENESAALDLLERHRQLLRPLFSKHAGHEIKTIGDAFLVEFGSALEATLCAIDIQSTIHGRNLERGEKLQVRVGIHVGDVVHQGGDVLGDAVNVASRIEPLAEPGGICVSEQVQGHVKNKISYPLVKLDAQRLKNVREPIDVYRVELPWEEKEIETGANLQLDRRRIAVLPFANMSQDSSDEYFSDGMTEELISTTSSITGLTLIARTSVMGYKGTTKKVEEIGKELSVGTVLEGSVRKAGNRLRITVQLIDVQSQGHLWAQSYDRELDDVFAVQSDIAKRVADALRIRILPNDEKQIEKKPTKSTEAYALYLKGRYYWNERSKEGLLKSVEYFKRAIEIDPEYALAYAGISDSYGVLGNHGYLPGHEAFTKSKENALKAVQYDDSCAEAHTSLAGALEGEYDWENAEKEYKRALELNPNYATGHHWYSMLLSARDRFDEALREAFRAQALDPLSPMIMAFCGTVYEAMRKYDLAEEQLKKALEIDPNFVPAHGNLYSVYLREGRYEEAERELDELGRIQPSLQPANRAALAELRAFAGKKEEARGILQELSSARSDIYIRPYSIILAYVGLGENEKAIEMIEKAYDDGEDWLHVIATDPLFATVKSEPKVVAVLKKIGVGN